MVSKWVLAYDHILCLLIRSLQSLTISLRSSLMAFAILSVLYSILKKASSSDEGVELVGCPDGSWNKDVFISQEGVSEKWAIFVFLQLRFSVRCLVSVLVDSLHLVIIDWEICYDSTGDLGMEQSAGLEVQLLILADFTMGTRIGCLPLQTK